MEMPKWFSSFSVVGFWFSFCAITRVEQHERKPKRESMASARVAKTQLEWHDIKRRHCFQWNKKEWWNKTKREREREQAQGILRLHIMEPSISYHGWLFGFSVTAMAVTLHWLPPLIFLESPLWSLLLLQEFSRERERKIGNRHLSNANISNVFLKAYVRTNTFCPFKRSLFFSFSKTLDFVRNQKKKKWNVRNEQQTCRRQIQRTLKLKVAVHLLRN